MSILEHADLVYLLARPQARLSFGRWAGGPAIVTQLELAGPTSGLPWGRRRDIGSKRERPYGKGMPSSSEAPNDALLIAVGERIRTLREVKDMAPKDFAAAAGFSLSYLWRLESGQQNLNLRSISRIALALGEPMTALLEGIEPDPATIGTRAYTRKSD